MRLALLSAATVGLWLASLPTDQATARTPAEVSFRDDVLPLLSDRCFECHGPDSNAREADLRLDKRDSAIADRGSRRVIVPGDAAESELMKRIATHDADLRMPPVTSGKQPLSKAEVEVLRRWIDQGAIWQQHWSFVRIERPKLPEVSQQEWVRNPIDQFVISKLEAAGVKPAPQASKTTQLRRASLALTGLPPQPAAVQAFLADKSVGAFERAVDRLLASPHYGERMAYVWLDAARYADTDGYQIDESRNNWPWRDWVIDSYNKNLPFNQFTIEQFAGDLLPNPTPQQIIATCFHRNHLTNGEGGRDPEESRVDYVLDRVNTMGTAWLGLTLGCCQCHSHKYDPITQHEYYELTAFFNSIDEDGQAGQRARPYYNYALPVDSPYREKLLEPHRAALRQAVAKYEYERTKATARFQDWLSEQRQAMQDVSAEPVEWSHLRAKELSATEAKLSLVQSADDSILVGHEANPDRVDFYIASESPVRRVAAIKVQALPHAKHSGGGLARSNSGNFVLSEVEVRLRQAGKGDSLPLAITAAEADYEQPGYSAELTFDGRPNSGWAVWSGDISQPRELLLQFAEPIEVPTGALLVVRLKHQSQNVKHFMGRFRLSVTNASQPTLDMYRSAPLQFLRTIDSIDELTPAQEQALLKFFLAHDGKVGTAGGQRTLAQLKLDAAGREASVKVMVLKQRSEARPTFVLQRGVWNQHGDQVHSDVPDVLGRLPAGAPRNRLTLAKWLVDRDNPLTARVTVNRYWQSLVGAGLVRTPADFGLQGERPTHPQLLDWLAAEFMASGWDIKALHRLIVTSATFRQSSRFRLELAERDPENRWLARGPRHRLPAAVIRDQALASAGLLSRNIGGPPVYPYQPQGVWQDANQGKFKYVQGTGDELYRRSLYGFWRRNAMPPAMFDAADRRTCQVNVVRTNSPMHALNLLNDPTYVEASRALAQEAIAAHGNSAAKQMSWGFERVLGRTIEPQELEVLLQQQAALQTRYAENPPAAVKLLQVGESAYPQNADAPQLAALTVIMSILLNLDETLNLE